MNVSIAKRPFIIFIYFEDMNESIAMTDHIGVSNVGKVSIILIILKNMNKSTAV